MSNRNRSRSHRRIVVAAATAAMTVAGAAFAATWTTESAGSAGVRGGTVTPMAVSLATPATTLYPGQSVDAAMTVRNPNGVDMVITAVTMNGAVTSSNAACNTAGHGVSFVNQTGSWLVAKGATVTVTMPRAAAMAATSDSSCQGATFTMPVKVTASVSGAETAAPSTTTTTAPRGNLVFEGHGNFGDVPVGTYQERVIIVRNTGNAAVSPVHASITSNPGNQFTLTSNSCNMRHVVVGGSCDFVVRFTPSSVMQAPVGGYVTVESPVSSQPMTMSINGKGVTSVQSGTVGAG